MKTLYRFLAEKQIQVPKLISTTRWISFIRPISEKDLKGKSEVLIRRAKEEDINFLVKCLETTDKNEPILSMDLRFWNQHGFRSLYVGYFADNPNPCCIEYFINDSENHLFTNMEYGDMYTLLDSKTVHGEGGYVLKQQRKKSVFFKFGVQRHKLLYIGGKRFFRCHIAANESRIPILKITNRLGCIPDHWISRVTINLKFFRSSVFVHHPIKDSDHGTFPLTVFGRDNG